MKNNLKYYRKLAKLTQLEVAQALQFKSTDRISRWEKGNAFPHVLNALKLQNLYGASIKDFYSIEDQDAVINE